MSGALHALVVVLAVAGAAGLVLRLAGSAFRLALRTAEVTAAEGLTEISARRGDLTALEERRTAERALRRTRRRDLLLALLWLLWLLVPPAVGITAYGYALASPLWLLKTGVRGQGSGVR